MDNVQWIIGCALIPTFPLDGNAIFNSHPYDGKEGQGWLRQPLDLMMMQADATTPNPSSPEEGN